MRIRHVLTLAVVALAVAIVAPALSAAPAPPPKPKPDKPLRPQQREDLRSIAEQTWSFFASGVDVDPVTSLPRDDVSDLTGSAPGEYTSPSNIGVYLDVVAARDLRVISPQEALARADAEVTTIEGLRKWNGFLLSWYDTANGNVITGPGGFGLGPNDWLDGQLISTVDNGWYASSLVVLRQAMPQLADRATALLDAMDFGTFYDSGDQSASITAGQQYGGWIVGQGPVVFHYGNLNTETRIGAYMGIGTHGMPGDVWWRTWRTLPADFDWQTQPPQGETVTIRDPQSDKSFDVFEGHYSYDGIDYVPSWGGSMFEGLMDNLVVPETKWGPHSFGANDRNYALASADYATKALGFPVRGRHACEPSRQSSLTREAPSR